jgi:hypothetical protein
MFVDIFVDKQNSPRKATSKLMYVSEGMPRMEHSHDPSWMNHPSG